MERYLLALFDAKLILREHIEMEVDELLNKRDELILQLAEPVRVVLATADAYTKFLSKCSRGAATAIFREKDAEVAFFDEAQAYELDQAAACLSSGTVQTAILGGRPQPDCRCEAAQLDKAALDQQGVPNAARRAQ